MNKIQSAIEDNLRSKGITNFRLYKNKQHYVLKVDATNEQIQKVVRDLKLNGHSSRVSVVYPQKRMFLKPNRLGYRQNRISCSIFTVQKRGLKRVTALVKIVVVPPPPKPPIRDLPDPNGNPK